MPVTDQMSGLRMNDNRKLDVDDDVVISGMSGRFPECESVEEFKQSLFDGIDLVTDDNRRWSSGIYGIPTRMGKLKNLQLFDAMFFGVNGKQADTMDPQLRKLLELTHEALIDAGVNPSEVRGSRTGVFIGNSGSDAMEFWTSDPDRIEGYSMTGCSRSMFANRISYAFDFKGPSSCVDSACSSSLLAMQQAVAAMKMDQCEAAIVGGSNIILKPHSSIQFSKLNMLGQQGKCMSFDASADGYARSEAAVVIYLQKSSDAKRIYATVVGAKTNTDGNKEEGITYPSGEMQNKLICELYDEVGLDPSKVTYLEAHGTGTKVGDPEEINAIADTFCRNRATPLPIGSVKSNMGHSEPASGLCSIIKVIIAMESGLIPQNLHYKKPNPEIPHLIDGRLRVVDKNESWSGGYVGINSFGFGGTNVHVILKCNPKSIQNTLVTNIPRIFTVSGRTSEATNYFLQRIDESSDNTELMALIQDVHKVNIPGHNYRGYSMYGNKCLKEVEQVKSDRRPIWFLYSGMGSQWAQIGRDMMKLDTFKTTIHKCAQILKPYGVDLVDVMLNPDESIFNITTNSFAAITATQIALTDTLLSLNIYPDGIVGHSLGEIGCAYADGSLTAEQTILASYFRARAIDESNAPEGAMASVGLSWEECKKRCPPGVFPACHNCQDNVTVSGPPDGVQKLIDELTAENIFARAVRSNGKAFHCKYITEAGPILKKYIDEIIPNPKPRSSKWISSSFPESEWGSDEAKLSSSFYNVNNLVSPVLFHEAMQHVPENAIVIEFAPHALMQAILKRSLGPDNTYIGLMRKEHEDNLSFFISNLGKLYIAGAHPRFLNLYQRISYPVSRGTPMMQSMIKWDHSVKWTVPKADIRSGETVIEVDLSKEEDQYLTGHIIDGRILFPATGYLILVWKTFAKSLNKDFEKFPVVFEDLQFHRATIMLKELPIRFLIRLLESSGNFEVCEGGSLVASGRIHTPHDITKEFSHLSKPSTDREPELLDLTTADIYKEFKLRGYDYGGIFKGISEADNRGNIALLKWNNNWISFIDTMLQTTVLRQDFRGLYVPTRIQKVVIDPKLHLDHIAKFEQKHENNLSNVPVYIYHTIELIKSAGIEVRGLKFSFASKRQQNHKSPTLEKYIYIPYENSQQLCEDSDRARIQSLTVFLQTVIENTLRVSKFKISEFAEERPANCLLVPDIIKITELESIALDYTVVTSKPVEPYKNMFGNIEVKIIRKDIIEGFANQNNNLIIARDLLGENKSKIIHSSLESLAPGGFLLTEETTGDISNFILSNFGLELVSKQIVGSNSYLLLRKSVAIVPNNLIVQISGDNLNWIEPVKEALKKSELDGTKIYLVVQNEELSGLMGLTTCIRHEPGGENIRSIFIQDKKGEIFSTTSPFLEKQLKKDLVFNVYKNGVWGTYRHLLLDTTTENCIVQSEHAYINTLTRGDLSSLKWIEGPLSKHKQNNSNQELCFVYYAPLNFKDVMLATGKLPPDALPEEQAKQDCILGLEFSGRDCQGNRVMGMVTSKGLATTVLAEPDFMWKVPETWSLEEASTVPVVYATSYYALIVRGRMKPGESILIHAGSGGVGQAAITIALHMGCIVFTTVGTQAKRDFIKKRFPQITDNHIGNSRDSSFEQLILYQTKGRGVDLVLNSLAEEKLQASVRCLAENGRFLEIGKVDFANNNTLKTAFFLKNISFHGVFLDSLFSTNNSDKKEIWRLVSEGIENGIVCPLPTTVFSENQVVQALRFIATGKHIGKVILKIRDEESRKRQKPAAKFVPAIPRTYIDPEKTYVLIGGLGGFGLELTNWLITRGATKIVLSSRNGVRTGYQSFCIRKWREMKITVIINTEDVTTEFSAQKLLAESNKIGPVGGIFNLAVVLRDGMMKQQTMRDFEEVCVPKINATNNLDIASRTLCPNLDYFIVFSSLSSGRGNGGQANYGYANSAMERICESRQAAGLPGLAIQWGLIGDVGIAMEILGGNDIVIAGTVPQRMSSCLQVLDNFMQLPYPVLSSKVLAEKYPNSPGANEASLTDIVVNILGMKDLKAINPNSSLSELGMDSIMGTEIKQILERNYDVNLSPLEIRGLTFTKLKEMNCEENSSLTKQISNKSDHIITDHDWKEIIPSESIIKVNSKSSNKEASSLFLIHPIEGLVDCLENLASEIQISVYGLQCTEDAPLTSINDLASFYNEQLRLIQPKGPYAICGYSFGASVAFEMALQLEKVGENVNLILLDGSPSSVANQIRVYGGIMKRANSIDEEQANALTYFVMRFRKLDHIKTIEDLMDYKSFEDKLSRVVEILKDATPFSDAVIRTAAISCYKMIIAANNYKPAGQYTGKVTLLKAKESYLNLGDDYGLGSMCKQQLSISEFEGNHRSILTGSIVVKIADIINKTLKA